MIHESIWRRFAPRVTAASLLAGLLFSMFSASALAQTTGISMELSGEAQLNGTVTVRFLDGVTPVGTFFDIWVCGSGAFAADSRPDDNLADEDNPDCIDLTFWERGSGGVLALQWALSEDDNPAIDPDTGLPYQGAAPVDGADYCGLEEPLVDREGTLLQAPYYLIVHDYSGGEHSNWLGPIACGAPREAVAVPVDSLWGQGLLAIGLLLLGMLALTRRRFNRIV